MTAALALTSSIAGAARASAGDRWIDSINPSDASDIVARVPEGVPEDAIAAIRAASDALPAWRALTGMQRAEHLYRWAGVVAERQESLAQAMAREVGKPIAEARGEAARGVVILRYYAGEAVRPVGSVIPSQAAGAMQFTLQEPLGVVALVTPWNFPVAIPLWKAAPALAFGNTVVLKPSEMSAYVATLLAETAAAAGMPLGVFNVLLGAGGTVGDVLIRQPMVRAVSFTGSMKVGTQVATICAKRNVRYQTEMGGKNVAIILPDADVAQAAALVAAGAMRYAGQKCTATSRVIVTREVEGTFLDALRATVAAMPLGPVTDPAAAVGPLISAASRANIRDVLAAAKAEVVYAGAVPASADFARGFWMAPMVLRGGSPDADLAQRELFGPVLAAFTADDLDHAIAIANDTPYGLSASLFTRDLRAAMTYIPRIHAGLVRVNADTTGVDPHAPFGGTKGSSSGSREQGPAAREFYTETKTVQINP
jgi:alpha-ketoglutaric semialdehyde dehydrogenase